MMTPHATEPELRTKILLAARSLFAKQGFDGTTVRQVCDAAGANVALVSYHFGGKENLFFALFEEYFPKPEELAPIRAQLQEPGEGLATLIERASMFVLGHSEMAAIMEQEILLRTPRMSVIQQKAHPIWAVLRDLLLEGRRRGLFVFRSIDTTLLMVLGAILFHKRSYYFRPLFLERPQDASHIAVDIVVHVYAALRATAHLPERFATPREEEELIT
ncbi:TetR family transcriptional regulator [Paenibacillus sp. TRM 82003]|nr:TetR family transcriptional regulator [Paenibacillus sp. TRM 82003]